MLPVLPAMGASWLAPRAGAGQVSVDHRELRTFHLTMVVRASYLALRFQRLYEGMNMVSDEAFSGSVLRVFEARVKTGCASILVEKFATTSVGVVADKAGNQGHFLGHHVGEGEDIVVFVSIWKNLDAIKAAFGDEWASSYLPAGYTDLIEDCWLKHIAVEKDWSAVAQMV